jgi:hypothetical protein
MFISMSGIESEVLRFDVEFQILERQCLEKILKMLNSLIPPDSPPQRLGATRRGKVRCYGIAKKVRLVLVG